MIRRSTKLELSDETLAAFNAAEDDLESTDPHVRQRAYDTFAELYENEILIAVRGDAILTNACFRAATTYRTAAAAQPVDELRPSTLHFKPLNDDHTAYAAHIQISNRNLTAVVMLNAPSDWSAAILHADYRRETFDKIFATAEEACSELHRHLTFVKETVERDTD
jgi:hypothetical protein